MNAAYVHHFAYALGDQANSLSEAVAAQRVRSGMEPLRQAGFEQHHVCSKGTDAYALARRAIEGMVDDLGDVDAIIYSTCIPLNGNVGSDEQFRATRDVKYLMDFPASRLQSEFGLSNAMVLGINQQACTGMLGSLYVAKAIICADDHIRRALCVTADRFPEGSLYEQAYNLISDGAAACLVSKEPEGFRILAGHTVTNGALSIASDDETVGSFFNYSHRVIHETLKKADLTMTDIDWIVPQNTNRLAWQVLCRLLPFDYGRVHYPTLSEVGHVISGDNIINLKHLADSGAVQRGEKLLLFMAGYGLNWQSIILEKV